MVGILFVQNSLLLLCLLLLFGDNSLFGGLFYVSSVLYTIILLFHAAGLCTFFISQIHMTEDSRLKLTALNLVKNIASTFCYPNHCVLISIVWSQNNPSVKSRCLIISTYLPSITFIDAVTECYVATSKSLIERYEVMFSWGFLLATSVTNPVVYTDFLFVFVLCWVSEGLCYELVTRSEEFCGLCVCNYICSRNFNSHLIAQFGCSTTEGELHNRICYLKTLELQMVYTSSNPTVRVFQSCGSFIGHITD